MTYTFVTIRVEAGSLNIRLNNAIPAGLRAALTLRVGSTSLPLADATGNSGFLIWAGAGLSWATGETVQFSLTESSTSTSTTTTTPKTFRALDRLPRAPDVKPLPASQRIPEGRPASDAYCYIGEGNGHTEYIRYPDGRIAETTRQTDAIRTMLAC